MSKKVQHYEYIKVLTMSHVILIFKISYIYKFTRMMKCSEKIGCILQGKIVFQVASHLTRIQTILFLTCQRVEII